MKKNFVLSAFAALVVAALAITGCDDPVESTVKVESVIVDVETKTLQVGQSFTLTATVLPSTAENKDISWVSTDTSIATVTDDGVVTAVAEGEVTITANSSDGSGKSDSCVVTVTTESVLEILPATGHGFDEVNEIKYSEAFVEGNPIPVAVALSASKGIASAVLTLVTDNPMLNGVLASMGLAEPFDLASLTPEQAGALGAIGIPSGDDVIGQTEAMIPFSGVVAMICGDSPGFPGGIGQFDITIEIKDADDSSIDYEHKTATATLKLKFTDDTPGTVAIAGNGFDIDEVLSIKRSEAGVVPVVVDIASSKGIDKMLVEISSSSTAFTEGLVDMEMGGEFDLANPTPELAGLLGALELLPFGDQVKGQTTLAFDITTFVPMIFEVTAEEGTDLTADFTLTVEDAFGGTETKTLSLDLVREVQLPNGDFEIATDSGTGSGKIGWYFYSDLAELTDKFWDSGNAGTAPQPFVGKSVTTSVEGHTGKGVEMKSQFMGFGSLGAFAAGNLYTGDFGLTRADLSNPSGTVHFGQPFTSRPAALSVWYKATAGTITHAKATAPLAVGDTDRYQIFIALVDGADYDPAAEGADGGKHWHTVDTADLAGTAINYDTDERVIAYGSFDSSENVAEWVQKTIELEYRSDRTPTHVVIVASASMYGDYFTGSTSSVLTVDDFELIY